VTDGLGPVLGASRPKIQKFAAIAMSGMMNT
jgi:hypothetical protein